MPTITKKQLEEYEQLRCDRDNGRLLTPDGLRFICEANNLDPEAIGKHILEVYGKFKAQKLIYRKAGYSKKFREEHEEEISERSANNVYFEIEDNTYILRTDNGGIVLKKEAIFLIPFPS